MFEGGAWVGRGRKLVKKREGWVEAPGRLAHNKIIGIYMSSIIDDLLFNRLKQQPASSLDNLQKTNRETLEELCKKIYLTSDSVLFSSDQHHYELTNKQTLHEQEYLIRVRIDKLGKSLSVEARLLKNFFFRRIGSRQNEILLLKEISNLQCITTRQSTIYMHLDSIVMTQEISLVLGEGMPRHRLVDFFNIVITRNLHEFSHFIGQHWDRAGNFVVVGQSNQQKLAKDLLIGQILGTTTSTFGVAEDSSQFKEIEVSMQKKKQEIRLIKENIVDESTLEQISKLFISSSDMNSAFWIKDNFQHLYTANERKFGSLLAVSKFVGAKRIDDYIYNTVKVNLRETMPKPINEGGSCYIFLAKAAITFISSLDSTAYPNQDRKDRLIAIKKLKPEFQKKFAHKLEHEKEIVSKLKGGCSYFIPKYFRAEAELDPPQTLMMEYIQGDELDYFVMTRQQTISLWTKICILLNLVHGLRYLANYQIVHLDLKPINVIICKQLMTKIIDYGQAFHKSVCNDSYSPGYTFPYVAPEVFTHFNKDPELRPPLQFSEKQDVFALGIVMGEIIFNSKFFNFTPAKFREVYSKKDVLERFLFSPQRIQSFGDNRIISTLCNIILRCLNSDPRKRPKLDWIAVSLKLLLSSCSS